MNEENYQYYDSIIYTVEQAIDIIQKVKYTDCFNQFYLEHELIPQLGLNNECLSEQPKELAKYFGKGLHLWQYPNQLSHYLVWLAYNAKHINSYLEIGCRWGGTFILTVEWLKKIGAPLKFAIAVDPITPTPFITKYIELSKDIPITYLQMYSNSEEFIQYYNYVLPEFVFIDGDHSLQGVMSNHLIARKTAKIIAHHDIKSNSCPATTVFWEYVKQAEDSFVYAEFIKQYKSVEGSFLGIGVLKKK